MSSVSPARRREIGELIARARRRRGLSQVVAAGLAGMSVAHLSIVERGGGKYTAVDLIERLAVALRVDPGELVGWSEPARCSTCGRAARDAGGVTVGARAGDR